MLAWSVAGKTRQYTLLDVTLPETATVRPGDVVTVSLSSRQLLRMAGLAYLLPLFAMAAGAWLAPKLIAGNGDLWSAAGMVFGLVVSAAAIRWAGKRPGAFEVPGLANPNN